MFHAPIQRETEERLVGDTWLYPYTIYNPVPQTAPASVAPPSPQPKVRIYQPEIPQPVPVLDPATTGSACDLTGFQAKGFLIVANGAPVQVTTVVQTADCLLQNGQFLISVPATITSTLVPDAFGATLPQTRLQVVLVDPSGNSVTIDLVPIRVVRP